MTFSRSDFHPKKEHSRSYVTDETYKALFTERKRKKARKWGQEPYFYIKNQKKADNFECLEKNRYFRLYQIEITNLIILTSNEKV